MAYDILDDPVYDSTPSPTSVIVSTPSATSPNFKRKKLLDACGLPSNATWEEANKVLKRKIVEARQSNDDESATHWSVIRDELEKRLAHHCAGCGVLISVRSNAVCQSCNSLNFAKSLRKPGWWHRFKGSGLSGSFRAMLGQHTDGKVAKLFGVNRALVIRARRYFNVPAKEKFRGTNQAVGREKQRRKWPSYILERLGTMSDQSFADLHGFCRYSVQAERRRRGIESFRSKRAARYA